MIPNVVHFCYFWPEANFNFPLYGYVAVASAHKFLKPERINFFIADDVGEPANEWWRRTKTLVTVNRVRPPREIHGNKLVHVAHKADVFRLQMLLEFGGIYLDLDTVCKRSFDKLFSNHCVLAHQTKDQKYGICNAVMLAEPGSNFIYKWLNEYKSFRSEGRDQYWDEHSVRLPLTLLKNYEGLRAEVNLLPASAFFEPGFDNTGLKALFESVVACPDAFCHHLWASYSWNRYLSRLDCETIRNVDTTYNLVARDILDGACDHDVLVNARKPLDDTDNPMNPFNERPSVDFVYNGNKYLFHGVRADDYIFENIAKKKTFFEIETLEFIKCRRLSGIYVDVGANIGNHSVYFLQETGCQGVIAIEGNEDVQTLLRQNINANAKRADRLVQIKTCFVSSIDELYFNKDNENNIGGSFVTAIPLGRTSIKVRAVHLDDLISSDARISLLKIDVEAHELEVLASGVQLLNRSKPEICLECCQLPLPQIANYLTRFNYLPLVDLPDGNCYFVVFPRWLVWLVTTMSDRLPFAISSRICWRIVRAYAILSGRLERHLDGVGTPSYVFH